MRARQSEQIRVAVPMLARCEGVDHSTDCEKHDAAAPSHSFAQWMPIRVRPFKVAARGASGKLHRLREQRRVGEKSCCVHDAVSDASHQASATFSSLHADPVMDECNQWQGS